MHEYIAVVVRHIISIRYIYIYNFTKELLSKGKLFKLQAGFVLLCVCFKQYNKNNSYYIINEAIFVLFLLYQTVVIY